jgi:type IV pilus assembly protein PilM
MNFLKRNKPLVGLDIGSSGIKAVELAKTRTGYELSSFAFEPLGPDAVVDGAIMDAPAVAECIKKTFMLGKFKPKAVATGVSGHSVIVKRVVVPAATPSEVETSISITRLLGPE